MIASTPSNYWTNNIFACFRHFISSLHFMSHCIVTHHYFDIITASCFRKLLSSNVIRDDLILLFSPTLFSFCRLKEGNLGTSLRIHTIEGCTWQITLLFLQHKNGVNEKRTDNPRITVQCTAIYSPRRLTLSREFVDLPDATNALTLATSPFSEALKMLSASIEIWSKITQKSIHICIQLKML
jgi:hypothetical protein